jgi:hypothetical protein
MTLVIANSAFAAPEDSIDNSVHKDLIKLEMEKSKEPPVKSPADDSFTEKEKYFFSYTSALSLRAGGALNFNELNKKNGDKKIPIAFGFNYMLKSENSKHQEYGFDLFSGDNPVFYARGGYKYIIDHTSDLRPYYKIGAAMRFDPGDHIETPFDFKSYSLVASAGIEDLTTDPHSIRVDLDIFWGKEDFLALCSIGWTYALH